MAEGGDYRYVDFASKALLGFRNNVVEIKDLPALLKHYGYTDCFCTYLLFDKGLLNCLKQYHSSVARYGGPCYANFLLVDVGSHNLAEVLQMVNEVTCYPFDNWGVSDEMVATYYGGMKGFASTWVQESFGKAQFCAELCGIFHNVKRAPVVEVANQLS